MQQPIPKTLEHFSGQMRLAMDALTRCFDYVSVETWEAGDSVYPAQQLDRAIGYLSRCFALAMDNVNAPRLSPELEAELRKVVSNG